jgi:hypothetical protein
MLSWDKSDGCLFTGLAVSGIKVARAQSGLCNGTGELLDAKQRSAGWRGEREGETQVAKSHE